MRTNFFKKLMPKKPYPSIDGIKKIIEMTADKVPEARNADPSRFVDLSIVKALETSGFIDSIYNF